MRTKADEVEGVIFPVLFGRSSRAIFNILMESLNTAYSLTHLYHSRVRPYKAVIDRHQMCSAQKQREYMGRPMFYIYSSKISNVI